MKRESTSILSAYMGKSLTVLVMIFVAALTASALMTGDGISRRGAIHICALSREPSGLLPQRYEALRLALSGAMRRSVTITERSGALEPGFDAYILPSFDWLRLADELDAVPLCGIESGGGRAEAVLLVSGVERDGVDAAALSAADVVFNSIESVGGFWAQASMLQTEGFRLPERLSEFRFAGNSANGCERAVLAVLSGRCSLGACGESVFSGLVEQGIVDAGRLRVVARSPAVPGTIVASARGCEASLREGLREARSELERGGANPGGSNPRIEELAPDVRRALEEAKALARRYRGQF